MRTSIFLMWIIATADSLSVFARSTSNPFPSATPTRWTELHSRLVRASKGISHVAYSRHFSYTAIAAYESIVGSRHSYHSLSGQLTNLKSFLKIPLKSIFWHASPNTVYADTLHDCNGSFGPCTKTIDSMEKAQQQQYINSGWMPLAVTPRHPEFPAAHATLSKAATVALYSLFGEDCKVPDNSCTDLEWLEEVTCLCRM